MRLGDMLRIKRKEKNLTLVELAEITGISRPYLSQLEGGTKQNPSERNIRILAEHLDIDLMELEFLVESETTNRIDHFKDLLDRNSKAYQELLNLIEVTSSNLSEHLMFCLTFNSTLRGNLPDDLGQNIVKLERISSEVLDSLRQHEEVAKSTKESIDELQERIQIPRYPERIEELIREVDSLGNMGLSYLEKQILLLKEVTDSK